MIDTEGAAPAAAPADARGVPTRDGAGDAAWGRNGALASALFLAACGSEQAGTSATPAGSSTPAPTPVTVAPPAPPTAAEASRFLAQASMGATRAEIDKVVSRGYSGWIDDQIAMARPTSYWDWLVAGGYNAASNISSYAGFDAMVWSQLIGAPDQLRQRVVTALLDILVVGIDGLNAQWRPFLMAAYMDVLADNAFGNYRTLLGAVTTSAAMAYYLTFLNNRKADTRTGAMPDENYARELMQLFTLGLYRLNSDGTQQTSNGAPIDTYTQADVTQLARVFTGLQLANSDNSTPDRMRLPLVMTASLHETGTSTVLGASINGANGMGSVDAALDTIFAHPNVPPFIGKLLIQRLVTSNPSPAYVARVAAVFADNGKQVRGDLAAVVRAVLLDSEARGSAALTKAEAGRLRTPVERLTGWARAFGATSPSNAWAIGDTTSGTSRLGQGIGRAPSVFNFYRPGYIPPATALAGAGLVAPEFQITNEQSVVGYVNFMYSLVANGIGDVKADYTAILTKAGDSAALVDEVNVLLAAGQLSGATVASIRAAVDSVATTATNAAINRVGIAIMLTLASPDYLTLR